ncbi:exo-alpha-sialidase [candidate division WOR-3 bacterium]|nr:exo-alpha-sialidase [candidate division WOR-3 bacterium]
MKWEPTVRLTVSATWPYLPYNNARCIEARGQTLHAVWGEASGATSTNVYYIKSQDNGETWGDAFKISTDPTTSDYPSMAVSGTQIYIVWKDVRDGNSEIYYRHSQDEGETWLDEMRLTEEPSFSDFPSAAASDSFIHVVWEDLRAGNREIYYKRSLDYGETWEDDQRLTSNEGNSRFACIEASGADLYIVWHDDAEGNYEIYFTHSPDRGETWEEAKRLTETTGASEHPSIETNEDNLYLAWMDQHDDHPGNSEIYFMQSADNGATWSEAQRLIDSDQHSHNPSISVADSNIYISWHDERFTTEQIFFIESSDLGSTWSRDTNLSNNAFTSYSPFMAVSDSFLHLIWHDPSQGNHEIMYKRGRIPVKEPEPGFTEALPDSKILFSVPSVMTENFMVTYSLPKPQEIILSLHDVTDRLIGYLDKGNKTQGQHTVTCLTQDIPKGIYICILRTEEGSIARKTTLIQ